MRGVGEPYIKNCTYCCVGYLKYFCLCFPLEFLWCHDIFKSFIHLEFILVYGVNWWFSLIFLHVPVQISQYHLLKRLFLLHFMLLSPVSNFGCPTQQYFCQYISQAREIKGKNKWHYIKKKKSFCTAKENINKMKREPTIWENIFANDTSDMGLSSKIYKELIQINARKTNNPIKNGQRT